MILKILTLELLLFLECQTALIYLIKSLSKYHLKIITLAMQVGGLGYSPGVGPIMLLTN